MQMLTRKLGRLIIFTYDLRGLNQITLLLVKLGNIKNGLVAEANRFRLRAV